MIILATMIGAILGLVLAGLESWGGWLGAFLGALIGWTMRWAVRREAAAVSARLWAEWRAAAGMPPEAFVASTISPPRVASPVTQPSPPPPSLATVPSPTLSPPPQPAAEPPAELPAEPTPASTASAPPPPPAGPTPLERAAAAARAWLLGGNTVVRVGLLLLFVGLSFLARYAAAAGLFPIELRLALVALAGVALLLVGFAARARRPDFALALQGGGVAVIYLTLFAAARFFDLLPPAPAFALMVVVCALGCALALLQDSQGLAGAAFAGGFATPLLLGGGGGDPLVPFGYYTLLNLAVLFIAARRAWRWLNLLGFAATFTAATAWGFAAYAPAHYLVAQLFLVASVLIYVAAGVLYAHRTPGRLGNVVDGTLLFGPALAGFGLQAGLVHDRPFATAFSALGFAALYLFTALAIGARRRELLVLREGALAIGVGFVTLAIPLALGARWTAAAWGLEGAGAVWLGVRQARWPQRLFGLALQGVAVLTWLAGIDGPGPDGPLLDPDFIGGLLVAVPLLASAWWLRRPATAGTGRAGAVYAPVEAVLAPAAFVGGFALWCGAWMLEATRLFAPAHGAGPSTWLRAIADIQLATMLAFVLSAWAAAALGRRAAWRVALWPGRATLAVLVLAFLGTTAAGVHVLLWPEMAVWAAAVAAHLRLLYLDDREAAAARGWLPATHVGGVWLAGGMVADSLWLGIERGRLWDTSWAGVASLVGAIAVLALLTLAAGRPRRRWPLDTHRVAYLWVAAIPVAAIVAVGALVAALLAAGEASPLPYLPILNPVDLSVALALAALLWWRRAVLSLRPIPMGAAALRSAPFAAGIALLAFAAINGVWLRIAHHYLGIAWDAGALLGDTAVETGFAIGWTLIALALMVAAHRRTTRALWLVGAGLLGLTVAKLLLVDLNNVGGAARIVAFIVVGVLMLVVGYLAPLPPRRTGTPEEVPA